MGLKFSNGGLFCALLLFCAAEGSVHSHEGDWPLSKMRWEDCYGEAQGKYPNGDNYQHTFHLFKHSPSLTALRQPYTSHTGSNTHILRHNFPHIQDFSLLSYLTLCRFALYLFLYLKIRDLQLLSYEITFLVEGQHFSK